MKIDFRGIKIFGVNGKEFTRDLKDKNGNVVQKALPLYREIGEAIFSLGKSYAMHKIGQDIYETGQAEMSTDELQEVQNILLHQDLNWLPMIPRQINEHLDAQKLKWSAKLLKNNAR